MVPDGKEFLRRVRALTDAQREHQAAKTPATRRKAWQKLMRALADALKTR